MVIKANIVETKEINVNLNQGTGGFNSPVQSVNNKTGHVVLDANDVGALPKSTVIPTKVSQLENDEEYLKSYTETDPTVPAWAKTPQKPSYTFAEVGAEPEGSAVKTVTAHNTNQYSHQDIRLLIDGLNSRLNALADSDDITLDQMSELVAYIKSNRTLINEITTNKINVSDIIDNLITNVPNRPLSASQGVVLKSMIETLDKSVPTKTSQLTNDSGFLTEIPSEYVTDTELNDKGYMSEQKFNLGLYTIVKSVNNVKPDANGNVNVVGGDGTIVYKPTWDDLAQGNTVFVPLEVTSDDVNYGGYHKVSNETPTTEQLRKGGTISFNEGGNGLVTMDYPQEDLAVMERTNGSVIAYNGLVLAVVALEDGMSYMGNTFNKGISFAQNDTVITHSLTVNDYIETTEINPIPVDFLPKSHQFGETTVTKDAITWDGNTDKVECVDPFGNGQNLFCLVSDAVPTLNDFANGATLTFGNNGTKELSSSDILQLGDVLTISTFEFGIVAKDNTTITVPYNGMNVTVTYPKKGVYFSWSPNGLVTALTINGYNGFETTTIDYLDNKFLEPFETVKVGTDTLTWNGKPSEYYHEGSVGTLYFVSNATPTMEDLANGVTLSSVANGQIETESLTSDQVYDHGSVIVLAAGMVVIVLDETKPTNWGYFEKKGVYFLKTTDGALVTSLTINGYTGFTEEQTKLKPEYMPDANIVFTIDSAAPGNTNSAVVTCNKSLTTMMKMSLEELQDAKVVWTTGGTPAYITRPINVMAVNASDGDRVIAVFLEMGDLASLDVYAVAIAESGNGVEQLAK